MILSILHISFRSSYFASSRSSLPLSILLSFFMILLIFLMPPPNLIFFFLMDFKLPPFGGESGPFESQKNRNESNGEKFKMEICAAAERWRRRGKMAATKVAATKVAAEVEVAAAAAADKAAVEAVRGG